MIVKKIVSNLIVFGLAHAVVDAICAAVIFNFLFLGISNATFIGLVVFYGVLAFGLQPVFGLLSDEIKAPKSFAIAGTILVAVGIFLTGNPYFAILFVGVGNAVFHVGAGTISLNLTPRKATAPGIFVAPGAIGLFAGTVIGRLGYFVGWHFLLLALIACCLMIAVKIPKINYKVKRAKVNYFEVILLLLLFSILIRSFIGLALVFPWKSDISLAVFLVLGVFLGKSLGGFLADRFGWTKVALASLLISAPMLAFFSSNSAIAIFGIFLFNMTMPITLVAISNILPGRPGFSFGLTCLALIFGALLTYLVAATIISNILILLAIAVSAIALYLALKMGKKKVFG